MGLAIIGLGLGDEKDISVKGLELVEAADTVYLEVYTSALQIGIDQLSTTYGRTVLPADRKLVEQEAESKLIRPAATGNVVLLVVGDPLGATTHIDLVRRAKEADVSVQVVHNASILSTIAETGLMPYKFGKTTSIPFTHPGYSPESFFDVILENQSIGAHTLLLLDLDPPKFMTVNDALVRILGIATKRGIANFDKTLVIGCARVGTKTQHIKSGTIKSLFDHDFGGAPHCLVVPGKLHFIEEEALR